MELTDDLQGARLSVVQAAELANMHPAHFRRLYRRGVFPKPKRTAKGKPYFDYELLAVIGDVLRSGIGVNQEEIVFYRRRPKGTTQVSRRAANKPASDPYLTDLAKVLPQVGVSKRELTPKKLNATLTALFGTTRPDLATAIPAIVQHLKSEE